MNTTIAWAVWSFSETGLVPVSDAEPEAGLVTTITDRGGSNQSRSLSETKPEIHKTRDQYGRWRWGSATGTDLVRPQMEGKDK